MPVMKQNIKNYGGGFNQTCIKFDIAGAISFAPSVFIASNERYFLF